MFVIFVALITAVSNSIFFLYIVSLTSRVSRKNHKPISDQNFAVCFNHNAELSYKKLGHKIKPFWIYFMYKNQSI